ncbi:MAG: hypothetical protein P8P30_04120 [Rickettsiales bacterium]|nr:hypothetical protein [Rickettsiales bacterium]
MKTEPLYLRKAAAETLSAIENGSFNTIYRWLLDETNAGRISTYFIGKRHYVKLSEVIKHIECYRTNLLTAGGGDYDQ